MTQREWLHYALYPGAHDQLDRIVREVVAPAVALAQTAGPPARWFFLRYTDELGAHVRLRFGGSEAVVNAVYRVVDPALRALLADRVPPAPRHGDVAQAGNGGAAEPGVAGCFHGFYEPEIDKYGGPQGMDLAEALFQVSSTVALAMLADPAAGGARRRAVALVLMQQGVESTADPASARAFWERYETHWSGGTGGSTAARRSRHRDVAVQRVTIAAEQMAEVARSPSLRLVLGTYAEAVRAYHVGLLANDHPISSADLAFHHTHLTNNRLGIPLTEEAYLARLLLEMGRRQH